MPRNVKGGKNYKKMAKNANTFDITKFRIDRQEDQQIARVVRVLGNLNMSCYCNDGITRVCKIRGTMIKRVFVEQGDFVLISLRELNKDATDAEKKELRGDILAKYPTEYISELRKEENINEALFVTLEMLIDGKTLNKNEEVGFEFDYSCQSDIEKSNAASEDVTNTIHELSVNDVNIDKL